IHLKENALKLLRGNATVRIHDDASDDGITIHKIDQKSDPQRTYDVKAENTQAVSQSSLVPVNDIKKEEPLSSSAGGCMLFGRLDFKHDKHPDMKSEIIAVAGYPNYAAHYPVHHLVCL